MNHFKSTKWQLLLLLAILILTGLSFLGSPYQGEMVLQHIPTVLGLLILAYLVHFKQISMLSFSCSVLFIVLHIIGARWIYSNVPYDHWLDQSFDFSPSDYFGWQRNHYDRLVHFFSGLLFVAPLSEFFQRQFRNKPGQAAALAVISVLAIGAGYEIGEWQIAMTFAPETAESYNGQQGDMWDPQKDMLLAFCGSIIAALYLRHWQAPQSETQTLSEN